MYGVRQQFLYVNTDMTMTDQGAYLQAARLLKSSDYTALTDRNRMPVYPFLISLLYEPGLSDEAFFARGKLLNIFLSLLILPILFVIFRKYLPLFTAVNLLLIHTFSLYIFKAAYVQTELLFYLLSFSTFVLLCRLLWQPSWRTAIATGSLLGLAHLTKASILPGLALYLGIALLQALSHALRSQHEANRYRQSLRHLAAPALLLVCFLLTIWPYLHNSQERFGHYFYNVNSTFYLWYDSWEEVEAGTKAHGDRVGWPQMSVEEIPNATKYFREHSLSQMGQRFFEGFLALFITTSRSYGYLKYVAILSSILFVFMVINRQKTVTLLKTYPYLVLFVTSFFTAYLALYAWYWPISAGNRFVLALFSPFMFTVDFVLYRLFKEQLSLKLSQNSPKVVHVGDVLNWAILGILVVDGYFILIERVGNLYGGF